MMHIKKELAISDSGFIFNPITGESFSVNPIGLEIINLIRSGESSDRIKGRILAKYSVSEATLEKDINDFTGSLSHFQLGEDAR
jgi:hypothetical protein